MAYVRSFEEIAKMKTLALVLSLGLLGTVASASTHQAAATSTDKTHQITAEVVSVDTMKNTVTIKGADGMEKTATVEGKAVGTLKALKPGEKVTLTCRDNDRGEHLAVTAIQVNKPMATEPKN
jgi:hypothetical protein